MNSCRCVLAAPRATRGRLPNDEIPEATPSRGAGQAAMRGAGAGILGLQSDFARVLSPLSARVDFHQDETETETEVSGTGERLSGGALNAALANELGKLVADFTGRGATKSRAFVQQDVVVCLLEDGATRGERNLVAAGDAQLVRWQRDAMQRAMGPQLIAAVERLTHRKVNVFLSGTDETGDSSIEAFVLEPE